MLYVCKEQQVCTILWKHQVTYLIRTYISISNGRSVRFGNNTVSESRQLPKQAITDLLYQHAIYIVPWLLQRVSNGMLDTAVKVLQHLTRTAVLAQLLFALSQQNCLHYRKRY